MPPRKQSTVQVNETDLDNFGKSNRLQIKDFEHVQIYSFRPNAKVKEQFFVYNTELLENDENDLVRFNDYLEQLNEAATKTTLGIRKSAKEKKQLQERVAQLEAELNASRDNVNSLRLELANANKPAHTFTAKQRKILDYIGTLSNNRKQTVINQIENFINQNPELKEYAMEQTADNADIYLMYNSLLCELTNAFWSPRVRLPYLVKQLKKQ